MGYEVTSSDGTVDMVEAADSYCQEGPLTTFFATGPGRAVVDSWSTRLASYRTADIARVRLVDEVRAPADARALETLSPSTRPPGPSTPPLSPSTPPLSPSTPPRWA